MIGEFVNNYEIDEIIDEGGMATVYLGIHNFLERKVAIKMLNPVLSKKPQYKKRFKNEANILAKFNHPNIISVYDYVENEKGLFIITEYVKGQTLDEYIDLVSGPMPETRATKLMSQMLNAVEHIHNNNIIHRDLKSSNFIITPDFEIKLIDFGIAKAIDTNNPLITKGETKVGTTIFMSPQQVRGKPLDRRTDIYSLGVCLFHISTGQYPYSTDISEYDIYNKIINEPFPNPKNFYIGVSEKIKEVISKSTEKHPLNRYQSCSELGIALTQAQIKKVKPNTLQLKTKIAEVTDLGLKDRLLNNRFIENFILLFSAIVFIAVLATGLYFLTKKDVRHIVEGEELLYYGDSLSSETIEKLYYGETVKIVKMTDNADKDGIKWLKVYSLRNNSGWVPENSIANTHTYRQINSIMGNHSAQMQTPAKYKKAIRKYFVNNKLIDDNYSDLKLFSEEKKIFEYNSITKGDFDSNEQEDFACVITNPKNRKNKLLIFFDNLEANISVNIEEPVKIKTIPKGKKGGRWFLGNVFKSSNVKNNEFSAKKYEYLKSDGILLLKTDSKENILYLYNKEEKSLNYYSQSK